MYKNYPLEEKEQQAVFQWAAYYPVLRWMHAIPNGVFLHGDKLKRAKQMARLKAAGLKPGVLDIFLPLPMGDFHGLYVEMKRSTGTSKISDSQGEFMDYAEKQGYKVVVCYGTREAIQAITEYAGLNYAGPP